jgi:hypothetical protein
MRQRTPIIDLLACANEVRLQTVDEATRRRKILKALAKKLMESDTDTNDAEPGEVQEYILRESFRTANAEHKKRLKRIGEHSASLNGRRR